MKISYIISHGVAEWVDFDHANNGTLSLCFNPKFDGALTLGSHAFAVTSGEVSVPIKLIKDGEHHPRLECNGGVFTVAGFIKSNGSIEPISNVDEALRRLIKECYLLTERNREQEERIARLEEICKGHNIFNFERKEK